MNCEHERLEIRFRESANQYVNQCLDCGWTSTAIKHDAIPLETREAAPAVDDDLRENWWATEREARRIQREMGLQDKRQAHQYYLKTPQWQQKRYLVLKRDGGLCQACLQSPATDVHHKTYKHWGDEPLFDLVSVCRECHDKIHRSSL